jgi:hypothetical protein
VRRAFLFSAPSIDREGERRGALFFFHLRRRRRFGGPRFGARGVAVALEDERDGPVGDESALKRAYCFAPGLVVRAEKHNRALGAGEVAEELRARTVRKRRRRERANYVAAPRRARAAVFVQAL